MNIGAQRYLRIPNTEFHFIIMLTLRLHLLKDLPICQLKDQRFQFMEQ